MSNIKFAYFDQDSSTFNSISENNSVKYKIEARGSNADSNKPARVRFNGVELGSLWENGLNLKIITETGQLVEEKVFTGAGSHVPMGQYLESLSDDKIVVFVSVGQLSTDSSADSYFESIGSSAYPKGRLISQVPRISYAAIYYPAMRRIICEGMQASIGSGMDSSANIEKVYDQLSDIAVTGVPLRAIEDFAEHRYVDRPDFITWPQGSTGVPISNYGLKPGDKVMIQFEAFRDLLAAQSGATVRFYHNYSKDGVYKNGVRHNITAVDKWEKFETVYTVPPDVDTVITGCDRYPLSAEIAGTVAVKNLIITKVSEQVRVDGNAAFGVNGIRTTYVKDSDLMANPVMQLLNLPLTNKRISGHNFKEFDLD